MVTLSSATRIYLAVGATDLRKGFDGLYGLVKSRFEVDPYSGHMFVFCNRRANRIKVLFFDGSGLWVCAKRIDKGTFAWPKEPGKGISKIEYTYAQMHLLLGGMDLQKTEPRKWIGR